ncbi:nitrous oxide reductase family maturation protein NosD [Marinobacterium arenosum]|uniref:nitrous oxide reductase family maturation protein NosD n=1 Tax=Marinobacterium arenosum TaxID=2862496 RepID=UPI001C955CBB|nr:nitrous oxide reductase family maturation protein NosD [Marinobacterium arenosum]MBY4674986.1 nitrous oxide reductase family maturation protein NosD [Marinobacterium arenosum]
MKLLGYSIVALTGWLMLDSAQAATWTVTPDQNLQQQLDQADAGDLLLLKPGAYLGNFVITRPLTLRGEAGVVLDGMGRKHALEIQAPDVTVEQLEIRNWGDDLTTLDSGIFVARQATGARIARNYLHGDTFGIWVDATADVRISHNRVKGNTAVRSADRGNGIHLFNVTGARIEHNEVWHTRDGIYIDTSNKNELIGNYLHDLRYGVHYMYSYHNRVSGNHTRNTRTGYALMQSKFLTVTNNRSENDANYGILMNYITNSTIRNNLISGVQNSRNPMMQQVSTRPEGKALFIYNSLYNKIIGNHFSHSDMGVHLTAGSENNILSGNAFIDNREQVKYVATRHQDWSHEGAGNYWSDYLGWDMNADGIGDTHYEPTDGVDRLLWKFPAAKVLLNSPAVETLRWVQRQFPVLKSQGVVDSHPLMSIPALVPDEAHAEGGEGDGNDAESEHDKHS